MAKGNQSGVMVDGTGDQPIYLYDESGRMMDPTLPAPNPPCPPLPVDPEAGNHGPQHTMQGEQPNVEWGGTLKPSKPQKADPYAGMGSF